MFSKESYTIDIRLDLISQAGVRALSMGSLLFANRACTIIGGIFMKFDYTKLTEEEKAKLEECRARKREAMERIEKRDEVIKIFHDWGISIDAIAFFCGTQNCVIRNRLKRMGFNVD